MQHTNSLIGDSEVIRLCNLLFSRSFRLVAWIPRVNLTAIAVCPSPRNCTRVPYHESRENLLHVVLAFLRPCRLRSLITAISCHVGLKKKACKVRIFTYNCLVKDRLAMLKQAKRTRQPKLGSDFQIRRTNVLREKISRPTEHKKPLLARGWNCDQGDQEQHR
jgi:hypothetical protein